MRTSVEDGLCGCGNALFLRRRAVGPNERIVAELGRIAVVALHPTRRYPNPSHVSPRCQNAEIIQRRIRNKQGKVIDDDLAPEETHRDVLTLFG